MRQILLMMLLGMLLVIVALTADCQPADIIVDDRPIEVVDTVWMLPTKALCTVCVGDAVVQIRAWPDYTYSFSQCSTLAAEEQGRICAFIEQW